ncbi:hypothetical protein [Absidia glauca]|uniref:Uncharacterized protein n=1 Tax=Absidia glauca TaxID=4829 RepID=A0A163KZF4_ABSGL|nr:hypothetical protein [Absidia glauca]
MERQSATMKWKQAYSDDGSTEGSSSCDTSLPPFSSLFPPAKASQLVGVSSLSSQKAASEQDRAITHAEVITPIVPFFYHHVGFGMESCMKVAELAQQENPL